MENGSKNEKLAVLVVEDDEDDFVLTRSLLEEIGDAKFDVQWSNTYEDALEKDVAGRVHRRKIGRGGAWRKAGSMNFAALSA